jgi:hypothetical protein
MRFIRFGECELIIREDQVMIKKDEDEKFLEVYHINNLSKVLHLVNISGKSALEVRKLVKSMLSTFAEDS